MKWLGLIGGTTWHSTATYYQQLNRLANQSAGGVTSAKLILVSLDFAEVSRSQESGGVASNESLILDAARRLKTAGAEGIVLCANTMHFFAEKVEGETGLPVIHIVDATAAAIKSQGIGRVVLLGTKYTMGMDFYRKRLEPHGIQWLVPGEDDQLYIHASIHEDMSRGIFSDETRRRYAEIIAGLVAQGAQGVIYGCTEIPLLMRPGDVSVPSFDTAVLHAEAASAFAMGD